MRSLDHGFPRLVELDVINDCHIVDISLTLPNEDEVSKCFVLEKVLELQSIDRY